MAVLLYGGLVIKHVCLQTDPVTKYFINNILITAYSDKSTKTKTGCVRKTDECSDSDYMHANRAYQGIISHFFFYITLHYYCLCVYVPRCLWISNHVVLI